MTPATRTLIYERDQHCCRRCGIYAYGGSIHHRKARGAGGSKDPRINQPANLVLVCGSGTTGCHGDIESNRDKARVEGWLLTDVAHAESTHLATPRGFVWLLNDGSVVYGGKGAA